MTVQHVGVGLELPQPPAWYENALCAQTDPEAFFPNKGETTQPAKRICQGCEVREECLEYALEREERFGVWGGFSERQRRRLKRGETVEPQMKPKRQPRQQACQFCKKVFDTFGKAQYCSEGCRSMGYSEARRGQNQRLREKRRAAIQAQEDAA